MSVIIPRQDTLLNSSHTLLTAAVHFLIHSIYSATTWDNISRFSNLHYIQESITVNNIYPSQVPHNKFSNRLSKFFSSNLIVRQLFNISSTWAIVYCLMVTHCTQLSVMLVNDSIDLPFHHCEKHQSYKVYTSPFWCSVTF